MTLVEPNYQSIQSLPSGQVGIIVEVYNEVNPCQYLVEFADTQSSWIVLSSSWTVNCDRSIMTGIQNIENNINLVERGVNLPTLQEI